MRGKLIVQALEIELLASGFNFAGEKKQCQALTSQSLDYHWNCYFPNSGNHMLSLILRLVSPTETIHLKTIEHKIRVVKLDHLTKRQVWILAASFAVASGGLTILKVLNDLGIM